MICSRAPFLFASLFALFVSILTACGGGGGGSGSSLSLTPISLKFTADYGKTLPPGQTVKIGYPKNTATVVVGFPDGVEQATWIDAAVLINANTNDISIGVNSTFLSPGTHTTTLRFLAVGENGHSLGYKDLPISYAISGELSASPSSLNLVGVIGRAESGTTLSVTATGGDSFGWSAAVSYATGKDWLLLNGKAKASGTALPASLNIKGTSSIAAGVYQATIVLTAKGKTLQIPITYTVRHPELSLDPLLLSFTGISGQTTLPLGRTVNVTSETGVAVNYSVAVDYTSGSNWLTLPTTGVATQTALTVQPATISLAPGLYGATVTLTPDNGTAPKHFSVSYFVMKSVLSATPANLDFVVNTATTPSPTGTTALSRTGGALRWTATPSEPWLSVTPSSGSKGSGESITVSLVAAELEPLEVALHTARITIAYEDGYGSKSRLEVPVSLDMRLPLFSVVTPYVGYTGRSDEVVIRGQGFSAMQGKNLLLGSNIVSNFTIVDDTEIRVNPPSSLTSQHHPIKTENALGLTRSIAELVVVDAPRYSYAAIPTADSARKLMFDAERQALYAVKWAGSNNRIDRYSFNGTGWGEATLPLTTARDVALTSDGKDLIVLSTDTLYHVDPTTFATTQTITNNPSGYYNYLDQLAFMSNGLGLMTIGSSWTYLWDFDALANTFNAISLETTRNLYKPRLAASLDRSVVLLGENGVTGAAVYRYDPGTRQLSSTPHTVGSLYLSIDRSGTLFCIDTKVYDGSFALLGTLPYSTSICSPDGTRAYALDFTDKKVHTYDVTQTNGAGGFVEVGTGIVFADPVGQFAPSLAISQDGGTLFIGGDQNTIILPLP